MSAAAAPEARPTALWFTVDEDPPVDLLALRITNKEAMAIERATGLDFGEWQDKVDSGSVLAQTALVWVIRRRDDPTLRFDDVEYVDATLRAEYPVEHGDGGDAGPFAEGAAGADVVESATTA